MSVYSVENLPDTADCFVFDTNILLFLHGFYRGNRNKNFVDTMRDYSKIANNSSYSETLVCSDIFTTYMSICGVSDVTVDGTNCFILPVGKKRTITKKITSGATVNFNYLVAVGYRRIGTNI